MSEADAWFLGVATVFLLLLGLEWKYRLRSVRVGTAVLAIVMFLFSQPNPHAAWRRAISTPAEQRVTVWPGRDGERLSDYQSGVFTMYQAVADNAAGYARERRLGVAVLFWLACTPGLRRVRPAAGSEREFPAGEPVAGADAPRRSA